MAEAQEPLDEHVSPEEPKVYTVRFSRQASEEVEAEMFRLAELSKEPIRAFAWKQELYAEAEKLFLFPHRFQIFPKE